jgi:hypothetical protein
VLHLLLLLLLSCLAVAGQQRQQQQLLQWQQQSELQQLHCGGCGALLRLRSGEQCQHPAKHNPASAASAQNQQNAKYDNIRWHAEVRTSWQCMPLKQQLH